MPTASAMAARRPASVFQGAHSDFAADRVRWLIQLRWFATSTVVFAGLFAGISGGFPGVAWRALVAVGCAGFSYNAALWWRVRRGAGSRTDRAATAQA